MKFFKPLLLTLGLVATVVAQYGIPDEDDAPPARAPNPAHYGSSGLALAPAVAVKEVSEVVSVPKATHSDGYDLTLHQIPMYAAPVTSAGVVFAEERSSPYASVRILPVKTVEQPVTYSVKPVAVQKVEIRKQSQPTSVYSPAKNVPVERIEISESPPTSSSVYSPAPVVRVVSAPALPVVKESYSRLAYSSGYGSGSAKEVVPIVKYVMDSDHRGTFSLETITGDGTTVRKNGHIKDLGDKKAQAMSGFYSYTGDDGNAYRVDWTADEAGFNVVGNHLPTA